MVLVTLRTLRRCQEVPNEGVIVGEGSKDIHFARGAELTVRVDLAAKIRVGVVAADIGPLKNPACLARGISLGVVGIAVAVWAVNIVIHTNPISRRRVKVLCLGGCRGNAGQHRSDSQNG